MKKKSILVISLMSIFLSFASAGEVDSLSLLQRDLGDSIELHGDHEIWYCPDNTCEIFKAKSKTPNLSSFVYLYLFHKSTYTYLNKSDGDNKAFREKAIEELEVRKSMESYCTEKDLDAQCILDGMQRALNISICFGRYDEGNFCYGCSENENICKKL
ncbi:hypothetical protein ACXWTF_04445 [Thiomicrolovo sp. ZZH C-3]